MYTTWVPAACESQERASSSARVASAEPSLVPGPRFELGCFGYRVQVFYVCGGQKTMCKNLFSPSTMWTPELRLLALVQVFFLAEPSHGLLSPSS